MKYKNIKLIAVDTKYQMDVFNKEYTVCKVKTGRWLVADENGEIVKSGRSETEALKYCERVENRRYNGNMFGYRFGKKICSTDIEEMVAVVWGGLYTVKNVNFKEDHYWNGTVIEVETGKVSEQVRMDYFINYMRIPEGLENRDAVELTLKEGVRF